MKINKLLVTILLSFVLSNVFAQPGNNQVVIQGKFTPSLSDAKKINTTPILKDSVYEVKNFEYTIQDIKMETPFKVSPIKPAKLSGDPLNKLYANYLSAGMGNYLTPYFELNHSKLRSRDTKYGVHIKHLSSAGDIDNYAFPAWSNNYVDFHFSKFLKKSVFDAKASYKRDVTHFYGFDTSPYPDSLLPDDVDNVQRYNLVAVDLHWYRYRMRKKDMNYDISTNYYFLNDFYQNAEHQLAFNAFADWNVDLIDELSAERIGVAVDEKFYHNTWDTLDAVNANLLSINPYYTFKMDGLTAEVGVKAEVKTDSNSIPFFYPLLKLKYAAIPDVLYINFNLVGGLYQNSLKTFSDENPFIISQIPLDFTNRKYQLNIGVSTSLSKSINLEAQLYYDQFENAAFFISDTNELYNNKFTAVYDDLSRVNFQTSIAYQMYEKVRLLLQGNYYIYTMDNELYPWHKHHLGVFHLS